MKKSEYKPKYFKTIPSRNPEDIISEAIKNREVPIMLDSLNERMEHLYIPPPYTLWRCIGKIKNGELVNMLQFLLTTQNQGHRFEIRKG